MNPIEIGRTLRGDTSGFIVGCRVGQLDAPNFGALVRVPLEDAFDIFGIIHNIHIDDDGIVRQLATADTVDDAIIADNRHNRNVPVEISVLTVGYRTNNQISHLLPPRPPLSLDTLYLCTEEELRQFTSHGHFGYFRHVLRQKDLPTGELIAAHLTQADAAHKAAGNKEWIEQATQELIVLLRDDYATLMEVLGALRDGLFLQNN